MSSAIDRLEGGDNKQALARFIVEYLEQNPLPMGSVDGLQSAVQTSTPAALPLGTNWANLGGGYAPALYRVVPGGGVLVDGVVKKPVAAAFGDVIAAVPANLAPKETHPAVAWTSLNEAAYVGPVRLDVNSTGQITLQSEALMVDYLIFSGILFWPGT